jgi:hypothetical protein
MDETFRSSAIVSNYTDEAICRHRGVTYELGHEGNHEIEKTDGLDEGETQNGVGEELAAEGGVAGNTVEEGSEDEADTDTSTGQTNGGGAHTQVLGDLDHGLGNLGLVAALLDGLEGVAGGGVEDRVHLLTLEGLEGRGCVEGNCELGVRSHPVRPIIHRELRLLCRQRLRKLTGDGALGDLDAERRTSDLRGHLAGQPGGEDTSGGHCIWM